jgi:hypothetical protein
MTRRDDWPDLATSPSPNALEALYSLPEHPEHPCTASPTTPNHEVPVVAAVRSREFCGMAGITEEVAIGYVHDFC